MSALAPEAAQYRLATPADAPLVVALLRELVDELGPADEAVRDRLAPDIATALASPQVRIVLAWAGPVPAPGRARGQPSAPVSADAETAIGLCRGDVLTGDPIFRLRGDSRCGYVDQMYVRPPWRGHGIGAELLRQLEAWFAAQDIAYALLHAAPRAVRFYARGGYQPNREMVKRLTDRDV